MPTDDSAVLSAGDFSSWLAHMQRALRGAGGSNVPCDGCTACCRSSQFIDIAPDETDTLAHVPAELLFPAPGRPAGHVVLGYDETGCCPMLIDNRCSIYEHRPQTCRTYDCRVLTAAGVELDDETKALIAERTQRWRFGYPNPDDRARQRAVRDAAEFLRQNEPQLPATQLAVRAIEVHDSFLGTVRGRSSATE